MANKEITIKYNGMDHTLAELAAMKGIKNTLEWRYAKFKKGLEKWDSVEKVIETPVVKNKNE